MVGMTMWLSGRIIKPGYARSNMYKEDTQLRKSILVRKK